MMSRDFFLVSLIFSVILFLGCLGDLDRDTTTSTVFSVEGYGLYENFEEGFRIIYPEDWSMMEDYMGTVVVFLSPVESESDFFRENLNVASEDLSGQDLSLEEYTDLGVSQLELIVTDYTLLESSSTSLAGGPAQRIVFSGRQGEYNLSWLQVYTIRDDRAYVVTFTGEGAGFSLFLDSAESIIDSFELI